MLDPSATPGTPHDITGRMLPDYWYDRMLDSDFVSIPVWSRRLEITVAALVNISLGYLLEGTGGTNFLVGKILI